jgi:hypothetical protein
MTPRLGTSEAGAKTPSTSAPRHQGLGAMTLYLDAALKGYNDSQTYLARIGAFWLGLGIFLARNTIQTIGFQFFGVTSVLGFINFRCQLWALFRCHPNSKFFHSLSITSIFSRLHGVLNVGKKITNYTI